MDKNEMDLVLMIRENDDPDTALEIAVRVIRDYLMRLESSEERSSYGPRGSA